MVRVAVVLDSDDWALIHGSVASSAQFVAKESPDMAAAYAALARAIDHQVGVTLRRGHA